MRAVIFLGVTKNRFKSEIFRQAPVPRDYLKRTPFSACAGLSAFVRRGTLSKRKTVFSVFFVYHTLPRLHGVYEGGGRL
jgi:hypothetical protein